MLSIRELACTDEKELHKLIDITERNLSNPKWWLPIKNTAREHFFDKEWTLFFGAFEDEKLVAASALFLNEYEYGESAGYLQLSKQSAVAEIGRCMVSPDYRGQNLMYKLNLQLLEKAKELGIEYILATAHPKNIASNTSLQKLGMEEKCTIVKNESYERNVFLLKI